MENAQPSLSYGGQKEESVRKYKSPAIGRAII
jgi:hypothetical protein